MTLTSNVCTLLMVGQVLTTIFASTLGTIFVGGSSVPLVIPYKSGKHSLLVFVSFSVVFIMLETVILIFVATTILLLQVECRPQYWYGQPAYYGNTGFGNVGGGNGLASLWLFCGSFNCGRG
ncbi:hypothetical protein L596_030408 [Steinernema carpocapsae]|uniref:Uncharacterized protein n=1 Tax=Steinernema carpocapsae TaxID=34508 RepID=A0A4U5LPA9_STECR|nr:hypothetical protein L596_030408 [Steinernema carpocapsae]